MEFTAGLALTRAHNLLMKDNGVAVIPAKFVTNVKIFIVMMVMSVSSKSD